MEKSTKQPSLTRTVISEPIMVLNKLLSVLNLEMPHIMEIEIPVLEITEKLTHELDLGNRKPLTPVL